MGCFGIRLACCIGVNIQGGLLDGFFAGAASVGIPARTPLACLPGKQNRQEAGVCHGKRFKHATKQRLNLQHTEHAALVLLGLWLEIAAGLRRCATFGPHRASTRHHAQSKRPSAVWGAATKKPIARKRQTEELRAP